MQPALINAYLAMLPRLEAENDLRLLGAVAAGVGNMKKQARSRYVQGLARAARPSERRGLTPDRMASLGATVIRTTKEAPAG